MIPGDWVPVFRDNDNELLGYLAPVSDAVAHVIPTTVFGHRLFDACAPPDAIAALESMGLSYLADRWELLLEGSRDPMAVQIVEASPEKVTVQCVDYGRMSDYGTRFTLAAPTDDRLRRR